MGGGGGGKYFPHKIDIQIAFHFAAYSTHITSPCYRIYASFHPTSQLGTKVRRPRVVMATRFLRTANFKSYPYAEGPTSQKVVDGRRWRRGRCRESRYRPWSSRWNDDLVEKGTSRDRVVHRRYTPLRTLLDGLYFPRFCCSFFFFPFSFFFSTESIVCTGVKLSVISDGMVRLTPARFYAPSWITYAWTSIVCTSSVCWKWEKKRNSTPKCSDASIMKSGEVVRGTCKFVQRKIHNF